MNDDFDRHEQDEHDGYVAPAVEDLESVDGASVTAAGTTT
jgi:hypothetical protein